MIVDCHTHVWQNPSQVGLPPASHAAARRPAEHVSEHMSAVQEVDVCLVYGFVSHYLQCEVPMSYVGQRIGLQPRRMVGIAGIDPSGDDWRERVTEAIDDWGFRGVAISPAMQDLHPMDSRALDLYDLCQSRGLPLIFETPGAWHPKAVLPYSRVDMLDAVAREFPDLRILISGMGYPYIDETLVLLEKFAGVHADTAHLACRPMVMSQALARAYEAGVLGKVLFASGFPFVRPRQAMSVAYDLCSSKRVGPQYVLPRQAVEDFVHRDALQLLGIPRPDGFVPSERVANESLEELLESEG